MNIMEQNIKSVLFIKIFVFLISSWIFHLGNNIIIFNKFLDKKYKFYRKTDIGNYRLLAKYKKNRDSIITGIKDELSSNEFHKRKNISYNENERTQKKELSSRCSSRNARGNKKAMKNKTCIFETKKYSYLEKKIFKELDYEDFLKNNRIITDKIYKKIIRRKYGLKLSLPIILILLLSVALISDYFCGYIIIAKFINTLTSYFGKNCFNILRDWLLSSPLKFMGVTVKQSPKEVVGMLLLFLNLFLVI
ncbi:fam-l protein [Plasmodium malariae]|uniref:Fam-l protein n=1 Tax=Plasmodium malariae TaxID=5858 RepID=A0A1D3JHE9_PLAMA|nr:fam-l protein [Plasmodium malariae]SBT85804.1 fam-l protein [Plasmodium malariae]